MEIIKEKYYLCDNDNSPLFTHSKGNKFDYNNFIHGIQRMIWGFFKKIAIADLLSTYVQSVFVNYNNYTGATVLIGIFFYSIQIYADFSGGIDMIMGVSQWFGIELPENFKAPLLSQSVTEYWKRWHMTTLRTTGRA